MTAARKRGLDGRQRPDDATAAVISGCSVKTVHSESRPTPVISAIDGRSQSDMPASGGTSGLTRWRLTTGSGSAADLKQPGPRTAAFAGSLPDNHTEKEIAASHWPSWMRPAPWRAPDRSRARRTEDYQQTIFRSRRRPRAAIRLTTHLRSVIRTRPLPKS